MDVTDLRFGERIIPLSVRRNLRAKRISIRLMPCHDGIVMTLPRRASVEAGLRFVHSKEDWVLSHVRENPAVLFADGVELPLLGQTIRVRHLAGRGVSALHAETRELHIHGGIEFLPRRVKDFLSRQLQSICNERSAELASQLGKNVTGVRIRDISTRWGSCNADGQLTFNWRLIFAPPFVLDYLIAHEVAHLAEMNHSPKFWQYVQQLHPDYKQAKTWLQKEGHRLYRFR